MRLAHIRYSTLARRILIYLTHKVHDSVSRKICASINHRPDTQLSFMKNWVVVVVVAGVTSILGILRRGGGGSGGGLRGRSSRGGRDSNALRVLRRSATPSRSVHRCEGVSGVDAAGQAKTCSVVCS